jgi:superfamily II RNA helicase
MHGGARAWPDVPVPLQVPHPAMHFPFELDVFQKEAILHLVRVPRVTWSAAR